MGVTTAIAGVVAAGSGIAGGIMGQGAAKSAAGQQAAAIRDATQFQQGVYGEGRQNLQPFISGGTSALDALLSFYGLPTVGEGGGAGALKAYDDFTRTPFYTFPLSQGLDAMQRSASARGQLNSPGTLAALQQYGQKYASSNFSTYIDALAKLANVGQSSATSLLQQGNQSALTLLGGQAGIGSANAAGTIGAQSSLNSAFSNLPALLRTAAQTYDASKTGGSSYTNQEIGFGAGNLWPS